MLLSEAQPCAAVLVLQLIMPLLVAFLALPTCLQCANTPYLLMHMQTSETPMALFGVKPGSMVGKPIHQYVDVLATLCDEITDVIGQMLLVVSSQLCLSDIRLHCQLALRRHGINVMVRL